MIVKIRFQQRGKKKYRVYNIVVCSSRRPRDGKYIEKLGYYDPHYKELEKKIFLSEDNCLKWMNEGAIFTNSVKNLIFKAYKNIGNTFSIKTSLKNNKKATARKAYRKRKREKSSEE